MLTNDWNIGLGSKIDPHRFHRKPWKPIISVENRPKFKFQTYRRRKPILTGKPTNITDKPIDITGLSVLKSINRFPVYTYQISYRVKYWHIWFIPLVVTCIGCQMWGLEFDSWCSHYFCTERGSKTERFSFFSVSTPFFTSPNFLGRVTSNF
jgi:hypothetical protein